MAVHSYDIVIVGAGIAGSALAHGLSTLSSTSKLIPRPLRICLLERSLAEPDRIVGELLQPGGVLALASLGLEACLEGIDAIPVHGYCVVHAGEKRQVHIPYPTGYEGRSFHHGKFVMKLREAALKAEGVDVREATVNGLVECPYTGKVLGVKAKRSVSSPSTVTGQDASTDEKRPEVDIFLAPLTIVADGCFSNFRSSVLTGTKSHNGPRKPATRSHFVGAILPDAKLPIPRHGTVALVPGSGPVLLYQIGEHDTRMLVDVKAPLPSDLKGFIETNVVPFLPATLHSPIELALHPPPDAPESHQRLRQMPNSFLPPTLQGSPTAKEGAILLGDAWNMRHPLTGGGMTVALGDVVLLRGYIGELLANGKAGEVVEVNGHPNGHATNEKQANCHGNGHALYDDDLDTDATHAALADWDCLSRVLHRWYWERKGLAATINILSVALYDLFGADAEELDVLRTGCFKYFERGGECINGPVSLLSGIAPSPVLLAYHFFSVAIYAIWVLFVHPRCVSPVGAGPPVMRRAYPWEYPALTWLSIRSFWMACVVFGPLVWSEVQWW